MRLADVGDATNSASRTEPRIGEKVAMSGWYSWYYDDYERDAGHLDHVSDSCYRRIIDFYMRTREPIPRDPIRLMYITRATPDQFAAAWPRIQGFFAEMDGFLHLKRCDTELDRQDAKRKFASEAGKKSALKRAHQTQLLTDYLSTTVQRPFNDPGNIGEGRGDKESINIIDSSIPARGTKNGNGHNHKTNLASPHASRALPGAVPHREFTKEERKDAWVQKMIQFMRAHWSSDATADAITAYYSDDPHEKKRGQKILDAADAEYAQRKASGTLNQQAMSAT